MVSKMLVVAGSFLLVVNFIGIFSYSEIEEGHPNVMEDHFQQISAEEFWDNAYQRTGEKTSDYAQRLCTLVSKRILFIDAKHTSPNFFENYLLWGHAKAQGGYEWKNTQRAVRSGGGFCSQHAIIFNNILREQDIESRIIELNGHVLNEVLLDHKWKTYDPDFNVVFKESIKQLESDSIKVNQAYLGAGRSKEEAIYLAQAFTSSEDNWHFSTSEKYSTFGFLFEKIALYMVWIFPMCLILLSVLINNYTWVKNKSLKPNQEKNKSPILRPKYPAIQPVV